MPQNAVYVSSLPRSDANPLWKWKGIQNKWIKSEEKRLSVTEFFHENGRKAEESVLGPGLGAGIGCGVGLGLGLVGGVGFGGSPWNKLEMVFGIGVGCGVGVGIGYGQGFGGGFSLDSLRSHFSRRKSKSRKRVVVQI